MIKFDVLVIRFDKLKCLIINNEADQKLFEIKLYGIIMREACDCSPENCSVYDTSNHIHVSGICIHPDGSQHDIHVSPKMKNKF